MAKSLAGVLAISIAAVLFAGCGGSNSSSTPTTESTSTTTTVPVDFKAQFIEIRSLTDSDSERTRNHPEVKSNQEATPERVQRIYSPTGDLMVEQANRYLKAKWPDDVQSEMNAHAKLVMEWGMFYKAASMFSTNEIRDKMLAYSSEAKSQLAVIEARLGVVRVKPPE